MSLTPDPVSPQPNRRNWADLGPRLGSAAVLIALTVLALMLGGYFFAAVIGVVFALAYREWETMVSRAPLQPLAFVRIGLLAVSALAFLRFGLPGSVALIAVACLLSVIGDREEALWRIAGLLFFALVLMALMMLRGSSSAGIYASVILGVTVWMTDSAAFFTGRQIGGEKLAPDISPSKTWSGALGGLLLGSVSGSVMWVIFTDSPLWIGVLLALGISVLGQLGDLTESAIKRRFRIKDSGDLIPGHGGLMDRIDSLTFGVMLVFVVGVLHGGIEGVAQGFLYW